MKQLAIALIAALAINTTVFAADASTTANALASPVAATSGAAPAAATPTTVTATKANTKKAHKAKAKKAAQKVSATPADTPVTAMSVGK